MLSKHERAVLEEAAAAMSPAQATAWMALIQAAEEQGKADQQIAMGVSPETVKLLRK